MALIAAADLAKSYAARTLFQSVSFEIAPRDKVGLVGVNGCGKTTLFRILTGEEEATSGTVYRSKDARLGVMQQTVEQAERTLYEAALDAFAPLMELERELGGVAARMAAAGGEELERLVRRQHTLSEDYERRGGLTYRSRARAALLGLGFTEAELAQQLCSMSGGQRNKAQLARLLLSEANLLLLDEPTNHLDIGAIAWLEDYLRSYDGAFVVISHDRYFLDRVTNRTLEIANGRLIASNGNYSRHRELQSSNKEIQLRHYLNQKREIRRLQGVVEQQRRWGQTHNFITAEAKLKQIRRLQANLVAPESDPEDIRFHFNAKEPGGNEVLLCDGLSKAYGKPLFSELSLLIRKGERVFLLGDNGCGKTTLLKIIMGRERPDRGRVRLGARVEPGYYEQTMESLNENSTALEEIHNAYPRMDLTEVRCALATFLLRGDDVFKQIGSLSGGERARVQLLKLMLSGANLLLLDEPTNHLDIHARDALERALEDYEGTLLIVTHDRYLVNRLADRVLYLDQDGVSECIGGYDDLLAMRAAKAAAQPAEKESAKPNAYKEQKERQSALNRARGAVRRAEEAIAGAEQALAQIQAQMALPTVASDYVKAGELAKQAEAAQAGLDGCYAAWEEAQAKLEELEAEPGD